MDRLTNSSGTLVILLKEDRGPSPYSPSRSHLCGSHFFLFLSSYEVKKTLLRITIVVGPVLSPTPFEASLNSYQNESKNTKFINILKKVKSLE